MKLATNIVIAGVTIATAVVLKKLVRSRRGAQVTPTDETGFGRFAHRHASPGFEALASLDDDLRAIGQASAHR
jgi:hypothetical protein